MTPSTDRSQPELTSEDGDRRTPVVQAGRLPTPREVAEALWLSSLLDIGAGGQASDDADGAPGAGRARRRDTDPQQAPADQQPVDQQPVDRQLSGQDRKEEEQGARPPADQDGRSGIRPVSGPLPPGRHSAEAAGWQPCGPAAGAQETRRRVGGEPQPASPAPWIVSGRATGPRPAVIGDPRAAWAALQPLRQEVPSGRMDALDEVATAEQLVQDRLGIPIFRPGRERRFDIVLVVDDSLSMTMWMDSVPQLVALLERHSSFRDVIVRYLDTDQPGEIMLRSQRFGGRLHAATEVLEPSGRRIVWLLTDALGHAWWTGAMSALLWSWGRRLPVALVNVVPRHFWDATGLRPQRVTMSVPGAPTTGSHPTWNFADEMGDRLERSEPELGLAVPVPILEPLPRRLLRWSRYLSGRASASDFTVELVGPSRPRGEEARRPWWDGSEEWPARDLVKNFRAQATAPATTLATYLAAGAPLTLAALRVVLAMAPEAGPRELSEVLASGMVRSSAARGKVRAGKEPEPILLTFADGVQEELLAYGRRADTRRVGIAALTALGAGVEALRGTERLLTSPDDARLPAVTEESRPYLEPLEKLLWALSGSYIVKARVLSDRLQVAATVPESAVEADSVRQVSMGNEIDASAPQPRSGSMGEPGVGARPAGDGAAYQGGYVSSMTTVGPAVDRQPARRSPIIWGNVPPRNLHFTGRRELLTELHERLGGEQADMPTAVLPQALHGMGGVGKSQLAVEYVYRHQGEYDIIWWIPAELPAQIGSALVDLAQRLGLPVGMEANTAIPAVLEALRTWTAGGRWLLVFDNAEDPREVRSYFPTGGSGRVLVTSRNMEWARVARRLEVDVFARSESVELLQRRDPDLSETDGARLAEALGDLPLAIEQAATWRAETGMPADEYLRLFQEKLEELLDTGAPMDYERPVTAAWNVSLDRLAVSNPAALRLLQMCAYFAPEPISRQLLAGAKVSIIPELDRALRDAIQLNRAIREINRYALARIDHRTNSLQMHRLVQAVLIGRMSAEEQETMRRGAHAVLADGDPHDPVGPETWAKYAELYPHVLATGAAGSDNTWLRELLLNEIKYLYFWGDHLGSSRLAEQTYDTWRDIHGEDAPHTIEVAAWLAWMYFVIGRYGDAAELNSRLLDICSRVFGPDGEPTMGTLGAVGADRRVNGSFAEARELSAEVHQRASRTLGIDDPVTLNAAHNLGVSLRLLGEFGDARELDEDTWRRRVQLFGEDYLDSLYSLDALAIDQRELGDYVGAQLKHEDLLGRFRHLFHNSESHPQILRASRNLAIARRKAGLHREALELSAEVRGRLLSRYGSDYPDTLAAALCHSMDLRHNGDLAAAQELCLETRDRYIRVLGDTHPHTLAATVNLALTYRLAGDVEAAHALDRETYTALQARLAIDHPSVLACGANLASDLFALGEFPRAHELDSELVRRSAQRLRADHPTTLVIQSNLALDLRALGRVDDAESLHASTMIQLDAVLGVEHPATRAAASWVRSDCDIDPLGL